MLFMCSVAILPLDSLRKRAQRCAYIYTHFYVEVQVGQSHTLHEAVLMHSLHTHLCVRTVDKWGDRLNRCENGKTRIVKWAYLQKKCCVPLKADISDLQFRNSLCALIDILVRLWVYCAVFNPFISNRFHYERNKWDEWVLDLILMI